MEFLTFLELSLKRVFRKPQNGQPCVKDLAREQEIRANIEGDIKNFDDRQQFLNDEINSYKKIHDDLQARYSTAQKERQQEKNVSEFNFYLEK